MRAAGLILACLGALALGAHRFAGPPRDNAGTVSPLTGGIALVSGLLLVVAGGRRRPSERGPAV
jgi:hypothetical protein